MRSLSYNHITVLYNSFTIDGCISGAILFKKYPGCNLFGLDYGQTMPSIPADTDYIIIVDISIEYMEMRKLASIGNCGLTYIDHNTSSIENFDQDISEHGDYKVGRVFPQRGEHFASCELTWKYCFPHIDIPLYVELIGSQATNRETPIYPSIPRDIVIEQLKIQENFVSAETCPEWMLLQQTDALSMTYLHRQYKKTAEFEHVKQNAFNANIADKMAICMETDHRHPHIFAGIYDEVIHDIMITFTKHNHEWIITIYSAKNDIDAVAIAKQFGGDGHFFKATFRIKNIHTIVKKIGNTYI